MNPTYLAPIATLIVGIAVAVIAYQQWMLARHKFRLDLFDRRYKIYEATAKFISIIFARANFTDEDLWDFCNGTRDSVFLYPKAIKDYLDEVKGRALDMRSFAIQLQDLPVGKERSDLVDRNHGEMVWLTDQMAALPERFSPYLGFQSAK